MSMTDDPRAGELSPGERQAFDALPREAATPPGLEERTVALLRRHGHLPTPLHAPRRGGAGVPHVWWAAAAAVAAITLFGSGIAVGQYIGTRNAVSLVNARDASEAADHMRRAGDQYVAALASLVQLPDSSDTQARDRARETAVRILGAAAEEIAHLAPDDPLAAAVLRGLNHRDRVEGPDAPSRTVVWY
jgi:hypothetical protein